MRNKAAIILAAISGVLIISCACGGRGRTKADKSDKHEAPVQYTYRIVNSYPHSTDSYTQGLYWHEGRLWESTGQYGSSALMEVELETGDVLRAVRLEDEYFGEGAALLGDRIYQLTWYNGQALVYDARTLEKVKTFTYNGEGWGLATDGEMLYMSDGTSRIAVVDPADFRKKKTINVKMEGRSVRQINEMEWIEGRIWANVYLGESIIIINPASGIVEGIVDMRGLLPEQERSQFTDVLNGIAYDPETGRIFVTGKLWPKLYQIELVKK